MAEDRAPACPLCDTEDGGTLVWRGEKLRVIRAQEAGFPAFYRVVWSAHVAEFSDLSRPGARPLHGGGDGGGAGPCASTCRPTKINLAALGNMVPHLHWHVIARFDWDSHFPAPVWAAAQRPSPVLHRKSAVQRRCCPRWNLICACAVGQAALVAG